ncbi:ARL2_Bind_BART domain-containing protein [Durusdinium trenchii]|uniref:ARL2_Bind_BART domain-containing protein n=1 Tax=Durusdinium trenchii TaxID=1381693 RepID=A0ABP0I208_9DINO
MVKPSEKLLQELRAYMEEEDFLLEVSCWAWEYCMKFPFEAPSRWEHPLEFTQLHAEYRELFEGRANEFCEQEGLDIQELLQGVASSLREEPGDTRALIDSLTASEDYLSFCKFMQRVRQRRDWAEGREVVPVEEDLGPKVPTPKRGLEQVPEEEQEGDQMD